MRRWNNACQASVRDGVVSRCHVRHDDKMPSFDQEKFGRQIEELKNTAQA